MNDDRVENTLNSVIELLNDQKTLAEKITTRKHGWKTANKALRKNVQQARVMLKDLRVESLNAE